MFHIIGEKINGTRGQVGRAIADRDSAFIQSLAARQAAAGAHRIDVNAGPVPTGSRTTSGGWWRSSRRPSTSAVPGQRQPRGADGGAGCHPHRPADQLDHRGASPAERSAAAGPGPRLPGHRARARRHRHPGGRAQRLAVIRRLLQLPGAGIDDADVYWTPWSWRCRRRSAPVSWRSTIAAVRAEFPWAHISAGLSNVSFGLPHGTW